MTIEDYFIKHNSLRARMIASQFPNITDETTTVEFMIEGLRFDPDSIGNGRQLLAINAPTVKDFLHHFHRLKSYNMPAPSQPTSTIYQKITSPFQIPRQPFYQTSPPPRRPQYNAGPAPPNLPHAYRPYSFHQQFMGVLQNHTDAQFRDTRHPNFNRPGATAKAEPNANHIIAYNNQDQAPYMNSDPRTLSPVIPYNWAYGARPMDPQASEQDHQIEQRGENNVKGIFTLDSAAHPTHIHKPPKSLPRPSNLSTRTASYHITPCTHAGTIQIRLHNNHSPLRVPCVATNSMHANLLSLHDTAL
eukprot:gb/GEZJ01003408.1/.p1 GENE.gb/GEZJ01003408.1/~~gb/GEZJ01003408.1/.p1  ORF type:complete len:303 (+),score=23.34 gb/GEZJ01003408.1/:2320-3228(+)